VNCNLSVSRFLHDIHFTSMSDVVRVLEGVTHMYTVMCIHEEWPKTGCWRTKPQQGAEVYLVYFIMNQSESQR
jgi:hypothetical protein